MAKILFVEDEENIRSMLEFSLKPHGFEMVHAGSVKEAEEILAKLRPDLILLDWMLPKVPGTDLLAYLKRHSALSSIPVIMLTAKALEQDKINGLELGADDYVTKPFSPKELIARIKSILRRAAIQAAEPSKQIIKIDNFIFKLSEKKIFYKELFIPVTKNEFLLLSLLAKNSKMTLSRSQILDHLVTYDADIQERAVDALIKRLRKKFNELNLPNPVETVRGFGYRFKISNVPLL